MQCIRDRHTITKQNAFFLLSSIWIVKKRWFFKERKDIDKEGTCLVWEKVCIPKEAGGLDGINLRIQILHYSLRIFTSLWTNMIPLGFNSFGQPNKKFINFLGLIILVDIFSVQGLLISVGLWILLPSRLVMKKHSDPDKINGWSMDEFLIYSHFLKIRVSL